MREIKTKIDFFSKDLIKAIGPGVYTGKKISRENPCH